MSVWCLSLLVQMSCTKSSEASHRHSPLSILRFCIKKTIQFCGCNVFHQILLQRWQIKSLTHHALSQISFIFRGCDRSRAPDYFHQLDLTSLVLSASATWLKKQWHFEKSLLLSESPEKCFLFPCLLKNQMDFLFAAEEWREGARNEGRGGKEGKGWMDSFQPSPLSAIFSSVKEDASELCKINWGLFSYEMQTEGKVITMTFRTSLKSFLHLLVGPSGLFSSLSVTNKYLIDVQHCLMCCTALGLQPTWKVTVTVVKLKVLSQKYI